MEVIKRTFNVEYKANENENRRVEGHASVFNIPSRSGGWFEEVIEEGAFDEALQVSDVRALFNHDPNHLLARTGSTLELIQDEKGLRYSFDMPKSRDDLIESMDRGDLNQSSFAFTIAENGDEWEERSGDIPLRRIKKVDRLFDVSLVTYPFYTEAGASLRSQFEESTKKPRDTVAANLRTRILYLLNLKLN